MIKFITYCKQCDLEEEYISTALVGCGRCNKNVKIKEEEVINDFYKYSSRSDK